MSYINNKILNDYKRIIDIMDETIEVKDKTIEVKDSIINDLAEQVAYWTNLYRELKNAEGETK